MNKTQFIRIWSVAMGAMDAMTGLLLVFFPGQVLKLLGIGLPSADALVFLSWIGVFVCGVGLSYGLALGRRSQGEAVWMFTALVRSMVAVFLLIQILSAALVPAWGLVAFSDAAVALVQVVILRLGWWKGVPQ